MDTVCKYALLEFIDEHLIFYAFIPVLCVCVLAIEIAKFLANHMNQDMRES